MQELTLNPQGVSEPDPLLFEQDQLLAEHLTRDEPRLRRFIQSRVFDTQDAEDILQDVFYELIQTYRLLKPVEQVTAWLYRVARNRITDLFRRPRAESLDSTDDDTPALLDLLPSPDDGPDAVYARTLLEDALDEALDELPAEQREVFIAHELQGKSFKELAEESGSSINTMLSRKRYAVVHLRQRLTEIDQQLLPETKRK